MTTDKSSFHPKPFKVDVPEQEISTLKAKLGLTRFPDELDEAGWDYGVPLRDMKRLVQYWKDGYDWRVHEKRINDALPQFTGDVEVKDFGTVNLHFVHQKSAVENAIPLLFIHGWPGSFLEVTKILPLLTDSSGEYPSFHVVAPSLPNYAFSEGVKKKGFGLVQYAEACDTLMRNLGYDEYVSQGGDWGAHISSALTHRFPKTAKAVHLNYARADPPTLWTRPFLYLQHTLFPYTAEEKAGLARFKWFKEKGYGYNSELSTQPQTVGYSLADSPSGLLAWIYEKLKNWTDDYPWTDDEVLTWISIYWFSRAGPAASGRIYYEVTQENSRAVIYKPSPHKTPIGHSYFPREIAPLPRTWIRSIGNVVFEAKHASGGHFAAHERPLELAGDTRKMFGKGGTCYGIIPGKDGYHTLRDIGES